MDGSHLVDLDDGDKDADEIDFRHGPFIEVMGGTHEIGEYWTVEPQFDLQGQGEEKAQLKKGKKDAGEKDHHCDKIIFLVVTTEKGVKDGSVSAHADGIQTQQGQEDSRNVGEQAAEGDGYNFADRVVRSLIEEGVASGAVYFFAGRRYYLMEEQVASGTGSEG